MEMEHGQLLTPEEVVDRIFLLVDENGDGERGTACREGPHAVCAVWLWASSTRPLLPLAMGWEGLHEISNTKHRSTRQLQSATAPLRGPDGGQACN